jgi:hypothetical protein
MVGALYQQSTQAGICVHTERKIGDVRIDNYVYDLWLPLIGATALGVYSVYCRLERSGTVYGMTLDELAKACRISKKTLIDINRCLSECGFIRTSAPQGQSRLLHYTTEIVVLDPPREIHPMMIKEKQHPKGYRALSHWLVDNFTQVETSGSVNENFRKVAECTPNIESLIVLKEDSLIPAEAVIDQPTPDPIQKTAEPIVEKPDEAQKAQKPKMTGVATSRKKDWLVEILLLRIFCTHPKDEPRRKANMIPATQLKNALLRREFGDAKGVDPVKRAEFTRDVHQTLRDWEDKRDLAKRQGKEVLNRPSNAAAIDRVTQEWRTVKKAAYLERTRPKPRIVPKQIEIEIPGGLYIAPGAVN